MANAVQKLHAARIASWVSFLNAGNAPGFVGGLLGEVGIPQADPRTSPNAQYVTDVAKWQALADYLWTTQIDAYNAAHAPSKTLDVTTWASGPQWGFYNLAEGTNSVTYTASGTNINLWASPGMLDVREAHVPQQAGVHYGTNVAGLDFGGGFGGSFDNAHLGSNGAGYYAPTAGDAAALAARNVRTVRLPFLWERIQPTLLGALDSTYLGYLTTFVAACGANGIGVVLDCHNYARYSYSLGGTANRTLKLRVLPGLSTTADVNGEGRLGGEYVRDLWRRLSTVFKGNTSLGGASAVLGYDLQNEPHDVGPDPVAAYAVIGADTNSTRTTAHNNGATHAVVQAFWDRLQPTSAGQALDATALSTLQADLADAVSQGMGVLLECAFQYPPTWAHSAIAPFKKQDNSTTWSSTNANGDNVKDWVWTQTGRNHIHDFISKVLAAIDLNKVHAIKLGGGPFGELAYPNDGGTAPYNFWAYGAAPQSGTDLATGMVQCPAAVRYPFVPFASGTSSTDNTTWTNWWLDGLKTFLLWQINEYKSAGFGGLLYVQHPSFGLRSNWTQADNGYRQAVAQGQDWDRLIAAYQGDRQCWPYSTWMDMVDPFSPPSVDSDKASWRKLYELAFARNKHWLIWGENTGGQTAADLTRVFGANGAIGTGYRGIVWLNHADLTTGGGSHASYANFASAISGASSGAFTGTTMYAWATTTQGWTGAGGTLSFDGGTGHTANGSLKQVYSGGATTNLGADDGGQKLNDPGSGNVLSYWVFVDNAGPAGTYGARAQWQNASFTYIDPTSTAYYDTSGNSVASVPKNAWTEVRSTFASGITAPNAYRIQLDCPSTTALTFWVDDFQRGNTGSGGRTIDGTLSWEILTQGLLSTIRGNGDTTCVIASGESWNIGGFPHSAPWLLEPTTGTGTHRYTTHLYFDPDGSGDYLTGSETWAQTLAAAQAAGYTDDADATAPTISSLSAGTPTSTAATITYSTSEAATDRAIYRTGAQATWFGTSVANTTLGTTHSIPLTGLAANTSYTVLVRSYDAAGNLATQSLTFSTPPSGGGSPVLTGINPISAPAGTPGLILVCTGTGFSNGTVMTVNGSPRATSFISATQVNGTLTPSDLSVTGTEPRTVSINVQ